MTFEWIPRERNKHADRLANEAMDAAAGTSARRGARAAQSPPDSPASRAVQPELGEEATTNRGWIPPIDEQPTRLVLLRHGQTPHTIEFRFAGRTDTPLNDTGLAQAAAAARRVARFAPSVIISSPLTRTRQTARAVTDELGLDPAVVVVDDGFIENDFGDWESLTSAEIAVKWPEEFGAWQRDQTVRPPGGESFSEVGARVRQARDRMLRSYPGHTIVVVSHVVPIKSLLRFALGAGPETFRAVHLDPACISVIDYYPSGASVVRVVNEGAFDLDGITGPTE